MKTTAKAKSKPQAPKEPTNKARKLPHLEQTVYVDDRKTLTPKPYLLELKYENTT